MKTATNPQQPTRLVTQTSTGSTTYATLRVFEPSTWSHAPLQQLQELIKHCGSPLQLSTVPALPGGDTASHHALVHTAVVTDPEDPDAISCAPEDRAALYSVRALPGILKSAPSARPLSIVGITAATPALATERLLQLAIDASPTLAPVVVACEADPGIAQAVATETLELRQADLLSQLVTDRHTFDIIVTSPSVAENLAALCNAQRGTEALATRVRHDGSRAHFEAVTTITNEAKQPCTGPLPLLFSSARFLAYIGHGHAASALHAAVLRALEDGLHTAELPHLHPYANRVSTGEFLSAVKERIGKTPTQLKLFEELHKLAQRRSQTPSLRLV